MAGITAAELEALPLIHSRTYVQELIALHIHAGFPGAPASVETPEGHFKLSKELSKLAAKAYAVRLEPGHTRLTKGRLGAVLASMAGQEGEASEGAPEELEDDDPLEGLVKSLAQDAVGRLEGLLQKAVAKQLSDRKEVIIAEAIRRSLA
jgi:hypothetical protein